MKILRRILVGLVVAIVLLGIFVAAAFNPYVQTWYAQSRLDAQPGLHATVEEVTAGLGNVEVTKLHLETANAVIDVPSLQATLPVTQAAWGNGVQVRKLVAKGWTIDFTQTTEPASAPTPASADTTGRPQSPPPAPEKVAAEELQQMLRTLLGGKALPYGLSLDGVEVEGDVLFLAPGRGTARMHVIIKGGGLSAGHAGEFAFDCEAASPWSGISMVAAQGQATLTATSSRRLERVALKGELVTRSEMSRENFTVQAELEVARAAGGTTGRLQLSQGARRLAEVLVHLADATGRLEGDWKVDLRTSDVAWWKEGQPLPAVVATGAGTFAGDAALERLQVRGQLATAVGQLGSVAPTLDRLGAVRVDAKFNLQRDGHDIRIDELTASLGAAGLAATLHTLQPSQVDDLTWTWNVADPKRDWMAGSFREFPLGWIADPTGKFALAGGDVTGDFVVRVADGDISLRPEKLLNAGGVSLQFSGRPVVTNLDLALAWQADCDAKGWRVQFLPLTLSRAGNRLGSLQAKISRAAGAESAVVVEAKWDVDLATVATLPEVPREAGITARSASGQFTANLGLGSQVEGQLNVVGHDPKHMLTASVSASERAGGEWSFQVPLKMNFDRELTDITAEGNWAPASAGRSYLRLTGEKAELDHLRRLARPLALMVGVPWPADLLAPAGQSPAASDGPDRVPFWGPVEGSLVVDLGQLLAGKKTYWNVGGSLEVSHRAVQLNHVRGQLAQGEGKSTPVMVDGQLTFDPDAPVPYVLKASGDIGIVDASAFMPTPKLLKSKKHEDEVEEEPLLEGHFNTSVTVAGSGRNLADLVGRTEQEIRLTSQGGIFRLLKVYIGDAFREAPPSAAAETIGGVGSLVGKLFAIKDGGGEKKVSQTTDDVLDLASQLSEIEFESLVIAAVRGADGAIRLTEFSLSGPTERLTGTGRFAGVGQVPLAGQPLSLNLTLGGRGRTAELIEKAGLSAGPKDAQGVTYLKPTLHFGGSLEHLDSSMWHDVLVKAATRPANPKQ